MPGDNAAHLISVVALCYNHERFVVECLNSIASQTYPHIELVIVDDCSTDRSQLVIRGWVEANWPSAKFIAHQRNAGVCRSLNQALAVCTGQYIAMVATDDCWLPDKLSSQARILDHAPEDVGVVYSDAHQIDESGRDLGSEFIATYRGTAPVAEGDIHKLLLHRNFIPAMATLVRRDVYDRVGPYDETLIFEDWDMWLRISREYKFAFCNRITAKYRIVSTSMIRTANEAIQESSDRLRLKHYNQGWIPDDCLHLVYGAAVRMAKRELRTSPKEARRLAQMALKHHVRFEALAITACVSLRVPAWLCLSLLNTYTKARERLEAVRVVASRSVSMRARA